MVKTARPQCLCGQDVHSEPSSSLHTLCCCRIELTPSCFYCFVLSGTKSMSLSHEKRGNMQTYSPVVGVKGAADPPVRNRSTFFLPAITKYKERVLKVLLCDVWFVVVQTINKVSQSCCISSCVKCISSPCSHLVL